MFYLMQKEQCLLWGFKMSEIEKLKEQVKQQKEIIRQLKDLVASLENENNDLKKEIPCQTTS